MVDYNATLSPPTRLLDWTLSTYVAAYMACKDNLEEDGAIWALNLRIKSFNLYMPKEFQGEHESAADKIFLDPKANPSALRLLVHGLRNERMIAQQGVFIFADQVLSDHGEVLSNLHAENGEMCLRKLVIPAALKLEYLKRLSMMNVNARSLFPGADGLGQSIFEVIAVSALDPYS